MSGEVLHLERRGGVRLLTIDREHAGNSVSVEVIAALEAALEMLRADGEARAVVIASRGERFFSTGGDVKQYRSIETRAQLDATFSRARDVLDGLEALPLPVIAAIDGLALGGGSELALACDLRFASTGARIGFPYTKLGLMPGWHGAERLVRACGYAAAMHLLLDAEPVDAREALRIGLVDRVIDGSAEDGALALAARLEAAAPLSLPAIKRSLLAAWRGPRDEARIVAVEAFARLWLSDDHREAEAAFAERRPPRFEGR